MATTNFGIINDVSSGTPVGSNDHNDVANLIDNQLGELLNFLDIGGVVSGWTITATDDLNVSSGEGWVADAHCKTTGEQAITGITADTTNYVFAQRKTASTGRISESFSEAEVNFVANTSGTPPSNSILIASGVVNAGGTQFSSVNNSPTGKVYRHGPINIGDGVDGNVAGQLDAKVQTVADTGTADTEFTVAHGLSRTPVGFIVTRIDDKGVVYDSGTAWDATNIKLKCSVANCAITLLIF